jgi:membrane fusion protein (multidrug efflux system)
MSAQGVVDMGTRQVLSIPQSCVQGSPDKRYVFVYDNGVARRRNIAIDQSADGQVEIVSGLTVGTPVVVAGAHRLRDGDAVCVSHNPPQ